MSRGEFGICEDYSPCGPSVLLGSSSDTANDKIERLFSSSVECRHVKIVIKEAGGDWAVLRAAVVVQRTATMLVNPPESARTFSSSHQNFKAGEEYANSMLDSTLGWLPFEAGAGGVGEWLRIDLGKTMHVHGVVTQGRKSVHIQYTSKYEVLTSVG